MGGPSLGIGGLYFIAVYSGIFLPLRIRHSGIDRVVTAHQSLKITACNDVGGRRFHRCGIFNCEVFHIGAAGE